MSKIAINVVLLPSKEAIKKIVKISKKQFKKSNGKIILDKKNCLPHISLVMGVIDKKDINQVTDILKETAMQFAPLKIIANYKSRTSSSGNAISEFAIEKKDDLQNLHETTINKLNKFLTFDASVDMFFSPPEIEEISLRWIKDHPQHNFDRFYPHITLEHGQIIEDKIAPISFLSDTLVLCHLGNRCTCRKVLYSVQLEKNSFIKKDII